MFIRRKKYLELLDRIENLEIAMKVQRQGMVDYLGSAGGWYSQIVQSRRILDNLLSFLGLQYYEEPPTMGIRRNKILMKNRRGSKC